MQNEDLTVFLITIGDPVFSHCMDAVSLQTLKSFKLNIIENYSPMSKAFQEMINRADTKYFIQLDEDMILNSDAIEQMYNTMLAAPDDVAMICFHLWDKDRERKIQGIKIYRTAYLKNVTWRDIKASEMDVIDQLSQLGYNWILHPEVVGQHGVYYTPETIYLRYKTMYEKDIRTWNILTLDIKKKADEFKRTGDINQLFALLGAAHGVINAPNCNDQEKDFKTYNLKALEAFKKIFLSETYIDLPYSEHKMITKQSALPIPFQEVQWKGHILTDLEVFIQKIQHFSRQRVICIWGAGQGGKTTLHILQRANVTAVAFIDKNTEKTGDVFEGLVVENPEYLLNRQEEVYVIVGSSYSSEIAKNLNEIGYKEFDDFIINKYI